MACGMHASGSRVTLCSLPGLFHLAHRRTLARSPLRAEWVRRAPAPRSWALCTKILSPELVSTAFCPPCPPGARRSLTLAALSLRRDSPCQRQEASLPCAEGHSASHTTRVLKGKRGPPTAISSLPEGMCGGRGGYTYGLCNGNLSCI